MEFKDLYIGERLSITPIFSDGTSSSVTYTSKAEELPAPNHIYISSPTASNLHGWIGKKFQIVITREDAPYLFTVQAIAQKNENNVFMILVKILSDFAKVQRRQFFRFKTELKIYIPNIGNVTTYDISGNGISLKMNKPLANNTIVEGIINLNNEYINFHGKVVRSKLVITNGKFKYYLICIHYPDIDRRYQNKIVKYINTKSKQLKRLKK